MPFEMSVYQTNEYKSALNEAGIKIVDVSDDFFAIERSIKLPLFGRKRIIEARGTPDKKQAVAFKDKSKEYYYGTIASTVVKKDFDFLIDLGFKKINNNTILIDLKLNEDELWKNLEKKSIRWGVKTAEKNGLTFEEAKNHDFKEFYKLYEKTAKMGGFGMENEKFVNGIIKTNIAKLFVIRHNNKIVAGGMILIDKKNNYVILDLTASSEDGQKLQAMPFLYWKMIIYSKNNGFDCFDLGGYDKEAREKEKTYKINKFKERFGGNIVEQEIYSTNWKYPFFRSILRKIRFMKGAYKKE